MGHAWTTRARPPETLGASPSESQGAGGGRPSRHSVTAGPRAQIADPTLVAALLGDLGFPAVPGAWLSGHPATLRAVSDEPRHYELHAEPGSFRIEGMPINVSVTRVLTGVRLAVLGIWLTVALGAAALASGWWRLPVGLGAFALSYAVISWPRSQSWLMNSIHRATGI